MIEEFRNESELARKIFLHFENLLAGIYGETYPHFTVKPEVSGNPSIGVKGRPVSADIVVFYDQVPYLSIEVKHEGSSSKDALHVDAVSQAFKQGYYLLPKYVATFTENEYCIFEFADNWDMGAAVAEEDKFLTTLEIKEALIERRRVVDLKSACKQILDFLKSNMES